MSTEESKIIDFDRARQRRNNARPSIVLPRDVAATGEFPIKCLASDGNVYWCKSPNNPNGVSSTVNEVVASVVGKALGAPVRDWVILDVPSELAGTRVQSETGDASARLPRVPMFGSLAIHNVEEDDTIHDVDRNGNYDGVPLLVAIWTLCNAEDIQVMYDLGHEKSVWSLDHGFWFGSHEYEWGLGEPDQLIGRPELPTIPPVIPEVHWDRAIGAVEKLPDDLDNLVVPEVPVEWNVAPETISTLTNYILRRKNYAIDSLTRLRNKSKRR